MAIDRIYGARDGKTYVDDDKQKPLYDPFLKIVSITDGGSITIGVVPRDPDTGEPQWGETWFMDLDRDGINRAIRALRSARDRTYGRDE